MPAEGEGLGGLDHGVAEVGLLVGAEVVRRAEVRKGGAEVVAAGRERPADGLEGVLVSERR